MYPKRGSVENHVTRWTFGAVGAWIATAGAALARQLVLTQQAPSR
jgi:hypothetical protein